MIESELGLVERAERFYEGCARAAGESVRGGRVVTVGSQTMGVGGAEGLLGGAMMGHWPGTITLGALSARSG